MDQFLTQLQQSLGNQVPKLAGGVAVLIAGWLVALVVEALVRAGLKRTTIDNRLAEWFRGEKKEGEKPFEVEAWFGRLAFWVTMLFVLVAFFETVGLTIVTGPLNQLLNEVFVYAPRLLAAFLLLLIAWVLASALRFVVTRAMAASKVDERLGDGAGVDKGKPVPLTRTVGESAYWVVFLLFLPAVLNALALQGLLQPVQSMINRVLEYLPNLFAAGLIFAAGWFVARIVQRIVTNLLAAMGTDRLGERVGLAPVLGPHKLSAILGLVVYVLILIPVLVAALDTLKLDAITHPASEMLNKILAVLPQIFGASLVLGLAYVVSRVVGSLVTSLLHSAGFDSLMERMGLAKPTIKDSQRPSAIAGYLVVVAVLLFASIEAANLLGFTLLAAKIAQFMDFAGLILVGLVLFGIGLFLANFASNAILSSRNPQARVLALAARVSIIAIVGAMALQQMNLGQRIIELAFGIVLGGLVLALAIAFGVGGREVAGRELDAWVTNIKANKKEG